MTTLLLVAVLVAAPVAYTAVASVAYAICCRTMDPRFWNGYNGPPMVQVAWLWPLTIVGMIVFWVGWKAFVKGVVLRVFAWAPTVFSYTDEALKRRRENLPRARVVK